MFVFRCFLAGLAAVGTLVAISSAATPDATSADVVAGTRPGDRVVLEAGATASNAVWRITSERGIGRARLPRPAAGWPARATLLLKLKELEGLRLSNGTVAVETSSKHPRKVALETSSRQSPNEPPRPRREVEVSVQRREGWLEVEIPSALFEGNPPSLDVAWVDYYR